MVGLLIWKCLFEDLVWFIFNILFFFFPSSPSDFVIFFSSLWEDSSSCYHGSERQLQVQWQHSEYISRGTFSGLLLRSSVAHSGLPSLHSLTYTKTWSLGLTWIHGSPWWGPTERENQRYWSCWWERSVEPAGPPPHLSGSFITSLFISELTYFMFFLLQLLPTDGMIRKHSHVKIGRYHQVNKTCSGWNGILTLCAAGCNNLSVSGDVSASDRAAGAGPVSTGVHDEVLPRDQGERRDEEDHRPLRTDWETAGGNVVFWVMN